MKNEREALPNPETNNEIITLYHRTKIKRVPEIMHNGLQPGRGSENHYGFSNYLMDKFAPECFREKGLLRSNTVFGWCVAIREIEPLTGKDTTIAISVPQSRVYVGDHSKSGIVIDGLGVIYSLAFDEEIEASKINLNDGAKWKISSLLSKKLFDEDVVYEATCLVSNNRRREIENLTERLRFKFLRMGKQIAEAYWESIVSFDEFKNNFRKNAVGNWVSKNHKQVLAYPEGMIIGPVAPSNLKIIFGYDPVLSLRG